MKKSRDYRIVKNEKIADQIYQMTVFAPDIARASAPGQFVHIRIPGDPSRILRRPISINYSDGKPGWIQLVYRIAGMGTKQLSNRKQGERINLLGPLGKGFDVSGADRILLIGGGCGVAPLRFPSEKWPNRKYCSALGFQNRSSAYQVPEFSLFSEEIRVATEDGSLGSKGMVTDLAEDMIKREKPDRILACGPIPMLKKVQRLAEKYRVSCQLSLEERMGCGIGGCLTCVCSIAEKDGWQYKRVCTDGPVFDSKEVIWDDEINFIHETLRRGV